MNVEKVVRDSIAAAIPYCFCFMQVYRANSCSVRSSINPGIPVSMVI